MTPAALWLVRRFGPWAAAFPAALVAIADLVRFGLGGPSWVGWIQPSEQALARPGYLIRIAWGRGSLRGRRGPALMLASGIAATAALILVGRVPGQHGRRTGPTSRT